MCAKRGHTKGMLSIGLKSEVAASEAHTLANWLHNPCSLNVPQRSAQGEN